MTTIVADADQTEVSTMSWGAVIAGAVVSAALTLLLLAFGMGVGFSVVSPWAG
jgi:high-affinity Fe2+/Pb2+ permease